MLSQGKKELLKAKDDIETGKSTVEEAFEELNKNEMLAAIEMGSATSQIASGEKELESSKDLMEESKEEAFDKASLTNIITSDMIKGILGAQNFNMPAGYITEDGTDYLIRVGDKIEDIEDLRNLTILDLDRSEEHT